jgi:hypothetical protein
MAAATIHQVSRFVNLIVQDILKTAPCPPTSSEESVPNPAINQATTYANIPCFVPVGVLWYAVDTQILYIGTGISGSGGSPGVVEVGAGGASGGQVFNIRTVSSTTYAPLVTDYAIVYTHTGAVTTTLNSSLVKGTTFRLKNDTGNTITVATPSGNIDNASTLSMPTALEAVDVMFDGMNWWVF